MTLEEKRMNIEKAAKFILSKIENAPEVVINTKTLEKLASALDVSIRTLFLT